VLSLTVNDAPLTVRVAGTAQWFPSVGGAAIVADRETVATALNTARPGAAVADEVWVLQSKLGAAAQIAHAPLNRLAVASHAGRLHALRADPLARGTLTLLTITSLVALALALVGLLLTVVTDRGDESGELFDLTAQGASASELRRYLRIRVTLVGAAGVAGGIATGAILAALVSSVVAVTAGATQPLPPLVLAFDWPLLAVGGALFVVAAATVVFAGTARKLA
jgi:ABC-type antimicrobial peptide transport system permease subunit